MNDEYSQIMKQIKSSKNLKGIELIQNTNNLIYNKNCKSNKDLNLKKSINKNNKSHIHNGKIGNKIGEIPMRNKNKKENIPKTPLLSSKQSRYISNKKNLNTIQCNENVIEKYINRNGYKLNNLYSKNTKSKKLIKSYISPLFDYNIKNSQKKISLDIRNNNAKPIKLINDGYKNLYTNKNNYKNYNKNNNNSNSSIDLKTSSLYETNSKKNNALKNHSIMNIKNSKNNLNNNPINNNYNKTKRKYISYTPDCTRKAALFTKKKNNNEANNKNKIKEEIKNMIEKELENRMTFFGTKANKNSIKGLSTNSSRNRNDDINIKSTNYSNSQSQKNILRYDNSNDIKNSIDKHEYNTINTEKKIHREKNTYKKYYALLETKIKKLYEEIEDIRNEEKNYILQLIDYKEKENECIYIRKIRDEIKKYKNVIDKSNKVCEEYSLEISKIKNILGTNEINDENKI